MTSANTSTQTLGKLIDILSRSIRIPFESAVPDLFILAKPPTKNNIICIIIFIIRKR